MRNYTILYLVILSFGLNSHSLLAQSKRAKAAKKGFAYEVYKSSKDSTDSSKAAKNKSKGAKVKSKTDSSNLFQGLELFIPKTQFIKPLYLVFNLRRKGETILQKLVERDLISGAGNDSTGIFDQDKEHFIFRVEGIKRQKYKVEIAVFQTDGNVYFINEEDEDLWEKSKKAKSKKH